MGFSKLSVAALLPLALLATAAPNPVAQEQEATQPEETPVNTPTPTPTPSAVYNPPRPPPEAICDKQYKSAFNSYLIHGRNFYEGTLGPNGESLKEDLQLNCGIALTEYTYGASDDKSWDWQVYFNYPIGPGKKNCVGDILSGYSVQNPVGCT